MLAAYVIGIASAVLGQTSELTYDDTFMDGLTYPARLAPAGGGGLYVTDQQSGKIIELDEFGVAGPTHDILELPVGIAVHPSGDVFISRLDGQVGRYNSSFELQEVLDPAPGTLVAANDLAVHPTSEKLYVVDSGGHQVVVFWDDPADDPDMGWGFYGSWGTAGSGMMELMTPQAITLDAALGRVIVADTDNSRVQVFDTEGIAIDRFGYRTAYVGMDATAWVARTAGIAVDSCSNIYLADALMGTVRAFDADGQDLDLANPPIGYGPGTGELRNPSDVMIEGGKLYVRST
ncbi:MAG: NHL repeat-containing protein [Planctomycetota bacterium]|jgi:tripartite motif-containing protein 2/3